jgi:hypothetical protein
VIVFYSFALTNFMWAFGHLEPSNCSSVIGFILLLVFISFTWVYDAIMCFFFFFCILEFRYIH